MKIQIKDDTVRIVNLMQPNMIMCVLAAAYHPSHILLLTYFVCVEGLEKKITYVPLLESATVRSGC